MLIEFKKDILAGQLDDEQIFQKYFVECSSYYFRELHSDATDELRLKKDIARVFNVHISEVYIVGSGKVGFSMNPSRFAEKFDARYEIRKEKRFKSDIDVAVVSPRLFDYVQDNFYDWSNGFRKNWKSNSYYTDETHFAPDSLKYKFLEYLARGWFRPDFSPVDYEISIGEERISEILGLWRKNTNRKVSYAIYKNWKFFWKYQKEGISKVRQKISMEVDL